MQIRLWGTTQENNEIINLLQQKLEDKIKIISSPYVSKNNNTQRIYIEIDLENRNYRKHPTPTDNSKKEVSQFNEKDFFKEIEKRIDRDS